MLFIDLHVPLVELERIDATRVDDFHRARSVCAQHPRNVVGDLWLRDPIGDPLQQHPFIPEQDIATRIQPRRIAHLRMGVPGTRREHRRLKAGRVSHLEIATPRFPRVGDRT